MHLTTVSVLALRIWPPFRDFIPKAPLGSTAFIQITAGVE